MKLEVVELIKHELSASTTALLGARDRVGLARGTGVVDVAAWELRHVQVIPISVDLSSWVFTLEHGGGGGIKLEPSSTLSTSMAPGE